MRKRLFITACLSVLLGVSSVLAGEENFFMRIDATAMRPAGSSSGFVIVDPNDDFNVEGTIHSLEAASAVTPRVTLGARWNEEEGVMIRWWAFDEIATALHESGNGLLWDTLSPPNISLLGYTGTAEADYHLESSLLDLAYTRRVLDDESYTAGFSVGLRRLEHQNTLVVEYAAVSRSVHVMIDSQAEGTGLRAAAWGSMRLSKRWVLRGEVGYAILVGETEMAVSSESLSAFPAIEVSGTQERTYSTIDGSIQLVYELGETIDLHLGVDLSRWMNTVDTPRFLDDINFASLNTQVSDAQWAGLTFGVGVHW